MEVTFIGKNTVGQFFDAENVSNIVKKTCWPSKSISLKTRAVT